MGSGVANALDADFSRQTSVWWTRWHCGSFLAQFLPVYRVKNHSTIVLYESVTAL
jgi:hypothetical protein